MLVKGPVYKIIEKTKRYCKASKKLGFNPLRSEFHSLFGYRSSQLICIDLLCGQHHSEPYIGEVFRACGVCNLGAGQGGTIEVVEECSCPSATNSWPGKQTITWNGEIQVVLILSVSFSMKWGNWTKVPSNSITVMLLQYKLKNSEDFKIGISRTLFSYPNLHKRPSRFYLETLIPSDKAPFQLSPGLSKVAFTPPTGFLPSLALASLISHLPQGFLTASFLIIHASLSSTIILSS